MRRTRALARWGLAGLLLGASGAAAAQDGAQADPALAPPWPAWRAAEGFLPWWHAAAVPDGEHRLIELVMSGQLPAWSREWIGAALAAAPSLDEALVHAGAQGRLLLWYVPAVEGQHSILTHLLDRYMTLGPWSDPDVVALASRAFLPLKLPAGGDLARRFGLTAPEVLEPALLILRPDGSVVARRDRQFTFDGGLLLTWLEEVLAAEGHPARPSAALAAAQLVFDAAPGDPVAALALAESLTLEGRGADATARIEEILAAAPPPEVESGAWLLRAVLARRGRRADEALVHLDRALGSSRTRESAALVATERARVLVGLGHFTEAQALLTADAFGPRSARRLGEDAWLLGLVQWCTGREDLARATWQRAVESYPGTIWAALADASLRPGSDGLPGESPLVRGMLDPRWPVETAPRGTDSADGRAVDATVGTVVARGLSFLLLQQRFGGQWEGPRWGGSPPGTEDLSDPDPIAGGDGTFANIETAITALCCLALHAWRADGPPGLLAALERGEAFLLRDDLVRRGSITAWVYADAYRLLHFSRRLPSLPPARAAEVRAAMVRWIQALLDQQRELGGPLRHYAAYSSTFVTAVAVWCLREAADAGLEVPQDALLSAADALQRCRDGQDGLFGYLVDAPQVFRTRAGAASRQPLCERALVLAGRRAPQTLGAALDVYLEAFPVAESARKTNFHVPALDGHAGYFFFHNLLPACIVARELGPAGATRRDELLDKLLALPEPDGTFLDSGISYGKSYGTAMGLLCLAALAAPQEQALTMLTIATLAEDGTPAAR